MMATTKKSLASVLVLAVALLGLVACGGGGGGEAKLTGTYALTAIKSGGVDVPAEEFGVTEFTITFEEDAKFTSLGDGEEITGTYTIAGNKVTMTPAEGDVLEATIDGDVITVSEDESGQDIEITLTKQK